MLAQLNSAALLGLSVHQVEIEVDAASGLPSWEIVGLPDTAVKESKERVKLAIRNSGLQFPLGKVVVNLAPADTKKEGSFFDLPIAIGASGRGVPYISACLDIKSSSGSSALLADTGTL